MIADVFVITLTLYPHGFKMSRGKVKKNAIFTFCTKTDSTFCPYLRISTKYPARFSLCYI